jgi:hypothetical protein
MAEAESSPLIGLICCAATKFTSSATRIPSGCPPSRPHPYHEVEVANYPLFAYPPYCLALAGRMAEVAERYELDLLHVHYALPHAVSALLARQMLAPRLSLPFVTTLHGTDITLVGQEPSYFAITKYSVGSSDGAAVSQYLNDRTRSVRRRETDAPSTIL